jgi:hypothetical protein
MNKRLLGVIAILTFALNLSAQTVEEIMELHKEVMGLEKWANVQTITLEGKTTFGNFELPYKSYIKGPLMRNEMTVGPMSITQVYDGQTAWMNNPQGGELQELPPAAITALQSRIDFGLDLLKVPDMEYLSLKGTKKMDGLEVFHLQYDSPVVPLTDFYVDTESFVLIRKDVTREWEGEKTVTTTNYSDYKIINGLLIAHSRETVMEGGSARSRQGGGAPGMGGGSFGGGGGSFSGGGGTFVVGGGGGAPGGGSMRMQGGGGGGMGSMMVGMMNRPGKDYITKLVFNEGLDNKIFTKESIGSIGGGGGRR